MESAEREYLAMAKASTSGSAPWTAKTSVWLRAPGGRKDSLDIEDGLANRIRHWGAVAAFRLSAILRSAEQ